MYARFAAAITQYAPDMALCEFYYAFADHNEPSTQHLQRAYYTKAQLAQEIYPTMLYHAPYYSFGINPCCWSKVFKKELLEQCLYPVTPKVKIGEDAAFTYPCLLAAESLAYVDGCLYHYRNNAQSMTAAFDPHLTETIFIPLDILRTYFDTDKRALFAQYQMYAAYLLQLWVRNQASLDCDLDRKGLRQSCARVLPKSGVAGTAGVCSRCLAKTGSGCRACCAAAKAGSAVFADQSLEFVLQIA